MGATILATKHVSHNDSGHSTTMSATTKKHIGIGHTENPYRPQTISATTMSALMISSLFLSGKPGNVREFDSCQGF